MNYDQFIGHVQHRARLGSQGDAVWAIQATLQTLAERLDPGEAKDLASQLPREFKIFFQVPAHSVRMSLDEFFERISEREQADLPDAIYHARVVIEVLQEAVSRGEIEDVLAQLPEAWRALFEAGIQGQLKVPETAAR